MALIGSRQAAGRLDKKPRDGPREQPGEGDDPELARILKALSKVPPKPVDAGSLPGSGGSLVLRKNTSSRSRGSGEDELDADKHPHGKYWRKVWESVGRLWRARVRTEHLSNLPGEVVVRLSIRPTGRLGLVELVRTDEGFRGAVEEALCIEAIRLAGPFDPIPESFGVDQLTINFFFLYN